MRNKPKRDNHYYENRLKTEFPKIYVDFVNGKFRNITDASIAAGLKKARTRLHELKNAWEKSSSAERQEFVEWLKTTIPNNKVSLPPPAFTSDHHLEPWANERIQKILTSRGIDARSIRDQIGMAAKDTSLESALRGSRILRQSVREKIEQWLASQP